MRGGNVLASNRQHTLHIACMQINATIRWRLRTRNVRCFFGVSFRNALKTKFNIFKYNNNDDKIHGMARGQVQIVCLFGRILCTSMHWHCYIASQPQTASVSCKSLQFICVCTTVVTHEIHTAARETTEQRCYIVWQVLRETRLIYVCMQCIYVQQCNAMWSSCANTRCTSHITQPDWSIVDNLLFTIHTTCTLIYMHSTIQ